MKENNQRNSRALAIPGNMKLLLREIKQLESAAIRMVRGGEKVLFL